MVSAGEEREVFSLEASPTAPGFERELIEAFARLHKLNERVGVVVGTSWAEAARDAGVPARSLATYDDVGGVLAALRSGAVTATVMSVSNATLARRRDPALQIGVDLPGDSGSVVWGVRKTDPALLRALNDYLGGVRRTATWSRLVVKYFGDDALVVLGRRRK